MKPTQREKILQFILGQPYVRYSDINRWGNNNYIGDPTRRLRELRNETPPRVKKLTPLEARALGYTGERDTFAVVHKETQQELFG